MQYGTSQNQCQRYNKNLSFHYFVLRRGCIIDKNARIGKNVVISNSEVYFPILIWSKTQMIDGFILSQYSN